MTPAFPGARCRALVLSTLAAVVLASPAHALRLIDYNILNYPGNSGPARDPLYRTILEPLDPDVMVTEETNSAAAVDEFLGSVLNTLEPGQWAAAPFVDGNDTDCAFFYKPAKVDYLGEWSFYPNPANQLRLVHVYRVRPVGYASGAAEMRFYAFHLKASTGSANVNQRAAEAAGIRDSMNAMPPGTHAFALGDFNFYTGTEPGLQRFIETQAVNIGQLYDPLGLQGVAWQDNASIAIKHTQSPCLSGGAACASGASTGGLDDRFDLILPTLNWNDGQGYELIVSSYTSVGNDGQHLNKNITDAPTIPEGAAYADALIHAADHLPVRVDLQLPAMLALDTSPIDFGAVIVGASPPGHIVAVGNPATPPADALDYSFTASAGFQAPAGNFAVVAGALPDQQVLSMDTGDVGALTGTATLTTDAPDAPVSVIDLSGTVLRHAVASLDSESVVASAAIDFGTHAAGAFDQQLVRVHDLGFDALQARLALTGAAVTGGDGHFSIVGGFDPSLIAGTGQSFELAFDDNGATPDSAYTATLTFTSADEPLPGAAPQPDLTVSLAAQVEGGVLAVGPKPPGSTRLYAPFPNPLEGASTVHFDLARGGAARVEVFDLSGRRIATLADRDFGAGRYVLRWTGLDDRGGAAGPGLYFIRLSAPGISPQTARLAVVR